MFSIISLFISLDKYVVKFKKVSKGKKCMRATTRSRSAHCATVMFLLAPSDSPHAHFLPVGGCNIYLNEILAFSAAPSTEGSIVLERDGGTRSATLRHALRVFPPSETCSAVTSTPSPTRANSTSGRQSSTKVT